MNDEQRQRAFDNLLDYVFNSKEETEEVLREEGLDPDKVREEGLQFIDKLTKKETEEE